MKRLSAQDHNALKALLQQKGLLPNAPDTPCDEASVWLAQSAVQRVWLQESIDGDARVNGLGVALWFDRVHSLQAVNQAVQTLVNRHETLRTVYSVNQGQLYAQVLPAKTFVPADPVRAPDTGAVTALLQTASPSVQGGDTWRVHPVPGAHNNECKGLVWLMHHAVCDWFGLQALGRELAALLAGATPEPVLALQPRHVRQREDGRNVTHTNALRDYWQLRLQGAPGFFSLPAVLSDLARNTDHKGCERHVLSLQAALAAELRALCRSLKTTPYFFFLTALVRVLQKLTLDDEQVVATTIAHRDKPGYADIAGCLSDLIPLRCNPLPDASFIDALRHVQTQASEDMRHADAGLCQIVDATRPERIPGKPALTQVMFNLLPPFTAQGLQVITAPLPVARTDLVLEITEAEGYNATVECRLGTFPPGYANRLAAAWQTEVIQAMAECQGAGLDVNGACATDPGTPPEPVPANTSDDPFSLFQRQALATPQATALVEKGHALDYATLLSHAEHYARQLQAQSAFFPGCRVVLWLPRSTDLVISVLACMNAGAVVVLLDPAHPAERQRRLLAAARPDLVIALDQEPPAARPGTPVLSARNLHQAPSATTPGQPDTESDKKSPQGGTAPAFIAFTSGSTGTPKGVVCTRQALANRLAWYVHEFPAAPDDVACLKTSPGFVDIYAEMLGPLCAGMPLVIASDSTGADPVALGELLQIHRVTRLVLVPTLLQALLDHGGPHDLDTLRLCFCSGEPLVPALAQRFLEARPSARLLNIYGSSEVTADATWSDIIAPIGGVVGIGRPLPGVSVAIVDAKGHAVHDGFPGELVVGGIGLATGYLDDPDLSRQRFRPVPALGGATGFFSGDLAIRLADDTLVLSGRRDRQFKLEGVRIDASEIEAALATLPEVSASRVVLDTRSTPSQLIAAVVGKAGATGDALRRRLQPLLPRAAIPQHWLWLEKLPVGPTGKVDDNSILAASTAALALNKSHTTPLMPLRTPTEAALAQHWTDVLGQTVNDRRARFFDLGGTSLKAIMAANRLKKAFSIDTGVRWLFETPTLEDLAARIDAAIAQRPETFSPPVTDRTPAPFAPPIATETTLAPLTFNQQWLVREFATNPQRTAYNLAIAYRIDHTPDFDAGVLLDALQGLSDRHAALRTRLVQTRGQWSQHVAPQGSALAITRATTPDMTDAKATHHRDALARIPFNLDAGALFRVEIHETGANRLYLFMSAHHAVIDGWSSERLMRDLALQLAARRGHADNTPAHPAGIDEIARRQNAAQPRLAGKLTAYQDYIAGGCFARCPSTGFGARRGGPVNRINVARETASSAAAPGRTPFIRGLCALTRALQAFNTLDQPVLIGFPEAGRHDPDLEDSAGFLANTVLGRFDLSGIDPHEDALETTWGQLQNALEFSEIPAFWLQDRGWKGLDDTSDDLQVMVVPENDFDWGLAVPGLDIITLGQAPGREARVDLALTITSTPAGQVCFGLEFDGTRIPAPFAQRLAARIKNCLTPTGSEPAPETPAIARAKDTPDVTGPARLENLVAGLVRTHPDQTVLSDARNRHTPASLWHRANEISQVMRRRQPAPRVVAVCGDRHTDWVAALLAIWQLGATVVIIDPQWPEERARFVIEDSGTTLIWSEDTGDGDLGRAQVLVPIDNTRPHVAQVTEPRSEGNPVAAIVYTSGSSGKPKGVPVRHDALIRLGHSLAAHYDVTATGTILQVAAPAFDVTLSDIALAWCAGAHLVVLPRHDVMPGTTLAHALTTWNITHMQVPAAVLAATALPQCPSLQVVAVGGEVCPTDTLDAWADGRKIFIVYGPTETTVTASLARYWPGQPSGCLGSPIAGNTLAVVDATGTPVSVGMPGELLIAGPQITPGYTGHAHDRTAAFGTAPWSCGSAIPSYRTGDRAWMDEDGNAWLLGRLDRQVKIHGQRVDPEDIEAVLRSHPDIRQVAVAVRPVMPAPSGATQHLVAWVVAADGVHLDPDRLRQWLSARVPPAWVPTRWVALDALPLNANGKTDWSALPDTGRSAPPEPPHGALPEAVPIHDRDDLFDFLHACWCELLERDDIEDDRSFFDYGGHSMLTVKLHERIEQTTGVSFPVGELFGHPTLAEMTDYVFKHINVVNGAP